MLNTREVSTDFAYLIWGRPLIFVQPTDIEGRYQTPYTVPCNGVISHGAQYGVFGFCWPHTQKQTQNKTRRAAFRVWLFSRSARNICNLTYTPDEPWLFLLRKNPKTPKLSPMAGPRWHGVWYLLLYICGPTWRNIRLRLAIPECNHVGVDISRSTDFAFLISKRAKLHSF